MPELTDLYYLIPLIVIEWALAFCAWRKWARKPPTKDEIDKPLIKPKDKIEPKQRRLEAVMGDVDFVPAK